MNQTNHNSDYSYSHINRIKNLYICLCIWIATSSVFGVVLGGQALLLQRTPAFTYGDLIQLWAYSSVGISGFCLPFCVPITWILKRMEIRRSGEESSLATVGLPPAPLWRSFGLVLLLVMALTPYCQNELAPAAQQRAGELVATRGAAALLRGMETDKALDLGRHVYAQTNRLGAYRFQSTRGPLSLELEEVEVTRSGQLRLAGGELEAGPLQLSFTEGTATMRAGMPWQAEATRGLLKRHLSGHPDASVLLAQRLASLLWAPVLLLLVIRAGPDWGQRGSLRRAVLLLGAAVAAGAVCAPFGYQLPRSAAGLLLAGTLPILPAACLCSMVRWRASWPGLQPGWGTASRGEGTYRILTDTTGILLVLCTAACSIALSERGERSATQTVAAVSSDVLPLLIPLAGCLSALAWAQRARFSGAAAGWRQLGRSPLQFCRPALRSGLVLAGASALLLGTIGPTAQRWVSPEQLNTGVFAGTVDDRLVLHPRETLSDQQRQLSLPPGQLTTTQLLRADGTWLSLGGSSLPLKLERNRRLHLLLLALSATVLGAAIGRLRARPEQIALWLGAALLVSWQSHLVLASLAGAGLLPVWLSGTLPAAVLAALASVLLRRPEQLGLPYSSSPVGTM